MAVSVAVTLVTGLWLDPLRAFAFLGTIETAVAILLYILVVLACLVYFLRNRRRGSTRSCTSSSRSRPSS